MGKLLKTRPQMIKKLLTVTKTIIKDCSLDNGGIVAANSAKEYYPKR